jgi:type IX secretion system PorP/SprF family membrane protein
MRIDSNSLRRLAFLFALGGLLTGAGMGEAKAQQDVMISQYLFNGLLINPGYAGSHPYTSSSLLHRSQWSQFDGAPTTSVVAVDGALRNNSMGVGVLMLHDQIGLTTQTDVSLNFAYRMRLGAGRLAFGLKGGLSNTRADLFAAETTDPGDPNYSENQQITQSGRFGFGMYYHLQRFYLGVTIPTLTTLGPNAQTVDPHMLATAGIVMKVSDGVMLKPSFLVKAVNAAPAQLDLNIHAFFQEKIWVGAGWRTGDGIVGMMEIQVTPELRIGYARDFTLSEIRDYSTGSNELLIGFDFGQGITAKRSPRYF